jgi:hypothetical protein
MSAARGRGTVVLLGALAVVAVPSAARAYWTAAGVGVGIAGTATLEPPTDVRADVSGADVTVAWTVPAQSFPVPAAVFDVRDDSGTAVCRAAAPAAASCSFTAPPGTVRYTVTAGFASWTAVSEPSNPVTVAPVPVDDGGAEPAPPPTR